TPNGRSIQAEGIAPDIALKNLEVKQSENNGSVSEKDLSGHLENPVNGDQEETDQPASTEVDDKDDDLSESDYQLFEALNLLKGLTIATRIHQGKG
ncbi:MAG: peptidase S41, partial [Gammaproteobacteria bacterium]|nr:peptidase S41 [Gammaproteobacteria bacterium]